MEKIRSMLHDSIHVKLYFTLLLSSISFRSSWCNSSYYSNRPSEKQQARQWIENKFCPPNSSDDLCLFFCIWPSSMVMIQMWKDPFQAFPSTPLVPAARLIFGGAVRPQTIFSALFLWDSSEDMSIGPDLLVKVSVSQDFRFIFIQSYCPYLQKKIYNIINLRRYLRYLVLIYALA